MSADEPHCTPSGHLVRVTITIPQQHRDRLAHQAARADRTLAAEVRRALRLYLSLPSQQTPAP